ncbi:cytochrome P450 [Methylobacterium sp. J-078]|uniref:cytochrome P450 n=1 Tax=Methylobacterium sp. J-078 TaxID=2836657 RepID=UPI001FB8DBAC|nr:cytochrome P450 [Methylobacterium sp. J-078]MCJ2046576.1 cytochrome P450 [Methylobacterium sp. J-078]
MESSRARVTTAVSKLPVTVDGAASLRTVLSEAGRAPGVLWTMLRSMVDAWPDEVYTRTLVETRLLGQRTAFVVDPVLIRTLLVDEAGALEREAFVTRALAPALGCGLLTADGGSWRAQRRTAAPIFRPERVRDFVPAMAAAAQATRARWLARPTGAGAFDLSTEMMRTALDIILATMTSGEGGLDETRFGAAMEDYLGQTNWKMAYVMFGAPAWLPHPGSRRGAAAARELRAAAAALIAARRARGGGGSDLLGLLLNARDPVTEAPMAEALLVDNLLTFVAAGHETVALALTWLFRLLADHPAVERRILDEIARVGTDFAADPGRLDALVYTRQVVMEGMRLYPPAPLIVRRTTRDIRLGDALIPAGRSVHVPIYALHRHRLLWDRPDAFDPDRFAPSLHAVRDRYAYLPFGAGPRVCIGMGLALQECLVILATLLPAFRLSPARPTMPEARFRVTLRPHGGMPMVPILRAG